jgi:nucleoside 2-deoxyribosyltransferase
MEIYIAGTLTYFNLIDEWHRATEWRKQLIEFLDDNNIKYFNPVYTFEKQDNHNLDHKLIVQQNKYYLDRADIMIVSLDEILQSPGTQWEIVYASVVKNIPVIAIGDKHWSPHINYGISQYCKNVDEVLNVLCNMFDQNNL